MMRWSDYTRTRCVSCGRFVRAMAPGVSGWHTWVYDMDGSPSLNDPVYQCSPCTDKNGYQHSNCTPPEAYQWRNDLAVLVEPRK